jgi:hypothetical protein
MNEQRIVNAALHTERSLKQNLVMRHPELLRAPTVEADNGNAQAVEAIFLEGVNRGEWDFVDADFEKAYIIASSRGEIVVLPEPPPIPGGFSSPEEFVQKAPLKQVQETLRNIETSKLPRNYAAELLTGEGSYRWNAARNFEQPQMTEEALAALRNGMGGKP